jgi:hypothetical protein
MVRRALGVVALLALSCAVAQAAVQIITGPYLQSVTQTGITVMWETSEPAASLVEFGKGGQLDRRAGHEEAVTIHEVWLEGLEPATEYSYRVVSGEAGSPVYAFKTAVLREQPFRFVVWGDNRSDPEMHHMVCEGMVAARPDIAVNVGDVVARGDDYSLWGREFFGPAAELFTRVPFWVAIGNHEGNTHWFYDFLSFPPPENYYSFDYGNSHFVVLDTNQDVSPSSAQHQWLVRDLESPASREARWRFAFYHHPPYSEGWDSPGYDGEEEVREYVAPVLEQYGVNMAFAGHTHDYERGYLNGVYHIITGGGGSALDHWYQDWPQVTVARSFYEFCTIDVQADRLLMQACHPDGTVFDEVRLGEWE